MSNFLQGSYVSVHFNDGTVIELIFISLHDSYFMGINNFGHTTLVPFANVKYIES
ncbi:hypothetical protein J2Y67_003898 [Neobacillus niacini]|nr:hypothetical protein [Neobacillus niacini]